MQYETLRSLAKTKRWDELESEWLATIEQPTAAADQLLPVIDAVVEAGQDKLAETMGWAWLSTMKQNHEPREALRLGRGLLLRLPDGEELREEIVELYRQTHKEHPELDAWVERSGLTGDMSVRRALRFLDVGLRLREGVYLTHRTEDRAARVIETDSDEGEITLQEARRTRTLPLSEVIEDYDIADENDFHVLQQLRPERIAQLVAKDVIALVTGILRSHRDRIDRDELKLLLVPAYIPPDKWSDWWSRVRAGVKKSPNLRIEGRSPMFLVYDPVARTLEEETWPAIREATTPRQWLDTLEGYFRAARQRKAKPDAAFLEQVKETLLRQIERFEQHGEPSAALGTALVVQRLEGEGIPSSEGLGGRALDMLRAADEPVQIVAGLKDGRLWTLAAECVSQAFPETWPALFAQMILYAPAGLCDSLARRVEKAGQGDLLCATAAQAVADPGRYTDAIMWLWKRPSVKTPLPVPPPLEMLSSILALVGPARLSEGKTAGQTVGEMRAKVRAGLSAKDYESFRACMKSPDVVMARAVRRQIERAEGLGPSVQGDLLNILASMFPDLYVKVEVAKWDDDSVLYFSREGLRAREDELHELVNVKMRENAKAIGEAAARGDLSENAEYKFALEERDLLRARVAQINRELSLARLLEPDEVPTDHVSIGQRVTLRPTNGGDPMVLTIMGVGDSDIGSHVFAYQTPIAMQLLGKRPGEKVSVGFDGKTEVEYEIADIEKAV